MISYTEAMYRAKTLLDKLLVIDQSDSTKMNKDCDRLNIIADQLYSVALPDELRCPRPINTATNESKVWCQQNGHCGCEDQEVLRRCYGESVYPEGD